ncbi:MAG TPA: hypothetical protein VF503_05195 [Sphingobium sp.]|uniref:hypothetical protein n=1 Tax=Sphingobium sp. TaxID=1912891 RepID=UPI002ED4C979
MLEDRTIGSTVADRSLRMVTALSAEVAVLRERLEIVERLAAERGLFGPAEVDAYRPAPEVAAGFKAKRKAFVERIFGAMRA